MKKVLSCFLLLGSFSSFATVIEYNDFSDTTGLTLNGNTLVVNNNLQLTNNIAWQGGSVFTTNAISLINDSSFATSFSFKIDNNSLGGDTDGLGADGLAFVIQTQNANVGGAGGGVACGHLLVHVRLDRLRASEERLVVARHLPPRHQRADAARVVLRPPRAPRHLQQLDLRVLDVPTGGRWRAVVSCK